MFLRNKTSPSTTRFQSFGRPALTPISRMPFAPARTHRFNMPASTNVPPRCNCATIRRRSEINRVEIKFAQIKSYCRDGRADISSRLCAQSAVFYERHLRGRWRVPRGPLRDQNQGHKPASIPVLPPQSPEFPNQCPCPKTTWLWRRSVSASFGGRRPPLNFTQTKCRRWMLPGAKTEAGIKHDDGLIFTWKSFAPAWLDEQGIANFDGFEMPFPRFSPVFTAHFLNGDFAGADFQPAIPDLAQTGMDLGAPSRPATAVFAGNKR